MSQEEREVDRPRPPRSFRIDDILAETKAPTSTTSSTCTSTTNGSGAAGTSSRPSLCSPASFPLNFGVDSLLSRPSTETPPSRYHESYYPVIPSGYWTPSYTCYTAAAHPCNTCYNRTTSASYYGSTKLTGHSDMYNQYSVQQPTSSQQYSQDPSSSNKTRRPRRPWTRAVFSNLQRKGLEKRFQLQKYLTKADRHQVASMLGLSDNQVKVWFQNRRMKWRQDARESVTSTNTEGAEAESSNSH